MLANNRVSRIERDFAAVCPRLESLVLTNNRVASFAEIDHLPKTLVRLSLADNVVANLPNYRLYVVWKLPSLKVLDFQKVTR